MENDNKEHQARVIPIRNLVYKSILARGEETPNPDEPLVQKECEVIPFDPVKREEQKKLKDRQKVIDWVVKNTKSF